ncbi:MAG: signal peptidase I [Clostridia bacterium]|nr:signal peptidase I [Clostridia bacterium]
MTEQRKRILGIYEWVEIITAALIAIVLIFTFVFRLVDVDGTSMLNTLHDKERLILSSLPYTPTRGDIVVVDQGDNKQPLIKRVIGLAGDTVAIDEETGEVYLNGEVLNEPYVDVPTAMEMMVGEITVPEGNVFVMGDNRAAGHSLDSRTFGCIDEDRLIGKAVFRLTPFNRMGGLYDKS